MTAWKRTNKSGLADETGVLKMGVIMTELEENLKEFNAFRCEQV